MSRFNVRLLPYDKSVEIDAETTILKGSIMAGVHINAPCGGKGTCGKCLIRVKEGDYETQFTPQLTEENRNKGYILACQTRAKGDLVVEVPIESQIRPGEKIAVGAKKEELYRLFHELAGEVRPRTQKICLRLSPPDLQDSISDLERLKRELSRMGFSTDHFHCGLPLLRKLGKILRDEDWDVTVTVYQSGTAIEVLDIQQKGLCDKRYGVAVDIGTTTVVVYLVNLINGEIVDVASSYNAQTRCGDDVITRIVYATEMDGLDELQRLVVDNINHLLLGMTKKHGIDPELIDKMVVTGNTTMTHLFYGVNPEWIRLEPYIPTASLFPVTRAKSVGIGIHEQAPVYSFPNVASYVGGDITAGILTSRIHTKEETSLFIDVGTNGEIVLGNKDWLMTCACSAGPCFEGSGIKFGMRAMEGAIEKVDIDPVTLNAECRVIGNVKPIGICGSGMIDALAEMYLTGVIDQKGKFREGLNNPRIRHGESGMEYVLAWRVESGIDREITLTEVDIDNLIRAKGAIYAGFTTLLGEVGMTFDDIDKLYIAGGFGRYIDVERAITIGLLPDMPLSKFEYLGNTAVTGAYLVLLSDRLREEAEDIARKMTYLDLSVCRPFMDEFMSAMFLPHTNIEAFPTVKRLLREVGNVKI
jgi:uncharacterized 2Fe-2S/4Fe-4S cluster protein (DUF4445 family)